MELADRLAEGISHLKNERYEQAVDHLRAVSDGLKGAEDLRDIRARAISLLAQALFQLGELDDASEVIRDALRLTRQLEDKDGLKQVRALQDELAKARTDRFQADVRLRELARTRETPLIELLRTPKDDGAAGVLIRKATAELEHRPALARALGEAALIASEKQGEAALRINARVTLARALPQRAGELLAQAHGIAADSGETNMISLIARAAEEMGAELPRERGPHGEF